MPLDAVNFHPLGPVKSADLQQFYNLITGVMIDQPTTLRNALSVGGNQGQTTVPLKVYGAVGQNTNLLDLYLDRTQAQPGFGFSAIGTLAWGPGGTAPQDTYMSRIALQNGHVSDTPGLLIAPLLEVDGALTVDGLATFKGGITTSGPGGGVTFGNTQINGTLGVTGAATLSGGLITTGISATTVGATGLSTLGSLDVTTTSRLRGAVTMDGALNVAGVSTLGAVTSSGDIISAGHLHANGNHVFFAASTAWMRWGASPGRFDFSHGLSVPDLATNGQIYAHGGRINFEASNVVSIIWRGDLGALYFPYGNGIYAHEMTVTSSVQGGKPAYVMGQNAGGRCYWWPASAIGPPALRSYTFTGSGPANAAFNTHTLTGAGAAGIVVNNGTSLTAVRPGYYVIFANVGGYNNTGVRIITEGITRATQDGNPNAPDFLAGVATHWVGFINAGGAIQIQARSQQAVCGTNISVTYVPTTDYNG